MKSKFLKVLSLLLFAEIMCASHTYAGGIISQPNSGGFSPNDPYVRIVSNPANQPWYAADGGKAYYNAWHHIQSEAFENFLEKYSRIIDNTTSATTLKDSVKNDEWHDFPTFGNAYELLTFEYPDTDDFSNFLLRVDAENRIIYTIRKSGDEYLCKFYIAFREDAVVCLSYNWIVNSKSPIKNILLPIDRELLD
ncbi:MAG: hypothetical protein IJI84_01745 [Clostridia bacterium]|nr:hypothetical protein [Clostridia bacterium]